MWRSYIPLAICTRISIALLTQTFFQPDEYFQSLEVAHHLVFGYGHLTWEWLTPKPIRSIVYPALNVPIYWLIKTTGLDDTSALVWGPKILHGLIASGTDIGLCRLTTKLAGQPYVPVALLISLTSLFHGLALSRSLSNSAETSLTTLALSYFPWHSSTATWRNDALKSLALAALACSVRPTNAVIWLYMFASLAWAHRKRPSDVVYLLGSASVIGFLIASLIVGLDSAYYGKVALTPLNFLVTNLSSVSLFYGRNPWHFYVSQGIPILCATALPFVVHAAYLTRFRPSSDPLNKAVGLITWTIAVYSLAGHKEWRFIHPLLPLMHVLASTSLVNLSHKKTTSERPWKMPIGMQHLLLVSLSIPGIIYVSRYHERAQVEVMAYLRSLPQEDSRTIGFLMPCHSTPWQAHLHRPDLADGGKLWALGCEPPLGGQVLADYKDQTDIFFASPKQYLRAHFPALVDIAFPPSLYPSAKPGSDIAEVKAWEHEWPQNLVFFGALLDEDEVRDMLLEKGYREVWHANYGWEGDDRRKGGVQVWRHPGSR